LTSKKGRPPSRVVGIKQVFIEKKKKAIWRRAGEWSYQVGKKTGRAGEKLKKLLLEKKTGVPAADSVREGSQKVERTEPSGPGNAIRRARTWADTIDKTRSRTMMEKTKKPWRRIV